MRHTPFFIFPVLLLALVSCKETAESVYESCCGTVPTADSFSFTLKFEDAHGNLVDSTVSAQVYIPNIFIIDSSGDNNHFFPFANSTVQQVISSVYSTEDGALLFSRDSFAPNDPSNGWDGRRPDGYFKGSFRYSVTIEFIGGQEKTYSGKACAYPCAAEGFPQAQLPQCAFPTQHDGNGGFDKSLYTPDDCF